MTYLRKLLEPRRKYYSSLLFEHWPELWHRSSRHNNSDPDVKPGHQRA